jgi:hypothetical protein
MHRIQRRGPGGRGQALPLSVGGGGMPVGAEGAVYEGVADGPGRPRPCHFEPLSGRGTQFAC